MTVLAPNPPVASAPGTNPGKPRSRPFVIGCALLAATSQLPGCANYPRTQSPSDEGGNVPSAQAIAAPLESPTEAGYLRLVDTYCSEFSVGDQSLGSLLRADTTFADMTRSLYQGALSNDQFIRRVSEVYPAPDSNVEAAGCVVNQLQKCFSERCDLPAPERRLPERNPPDGLHVFGVSSGQGG